jgi:uncharacterized protein YjbJ (UPF0337 family)
MNNKIFQGRWDEIKAHLQNQWRKLTEEEFYEIRGTHSMLYGKLQEHYGYTLIGAENAVKAFKIAHKC